MNDVNEYKVIGYCDNDQCDNEFTKEDEYLIFEDDLFCDSICYTRYMIKHGMVTEKGNT